MVSPVDVKTVQIMVFNNLVMVFNNLGAILEDQKRARICYG